MVDMFSIWKCLSLSSSLVVLFLSLTVFCLHFLTLVSTSNCLTSTKIDLNLRILEEVNQFVGGNQNGKERVEKGWR